MRCYVVFFNPDDADDFRKRVDALCKTSRLPRASVHEKTDSTDGRTFGMYIDEATAKKFSQFQSAFPTGEWLEDC